MKTSTLIKDEHRGEAAPNDAAVQTARAERSPSRSKERRVEAGRRAKGLGERPEPRIPARAAQQQRGCSLLRFTFPPAAWRRSRCVSVAPLLVHLPVRPKVPSGIRTGLLPPCPARCQHSEVPVTGDPRGLPRRLQTRLHPRAQPADTVWARA